MPIYTHQCFNLDCEFEWEDIFSLSDPVPEVCPECGEGKVQRVMSLCAPGKVELGRHEMKAKIKEDARQLCRDASKSENLLANLVGEDKFQANKVLEKKVSANRPKIKSSRKKSA